jgi:hypothetical protein
VLSWARTLAREVLISEASSAGEPAALTAAAERVFARLAERLAGLFGVAGYRALLTRALGLARGEVPGLALVTVDAKAAGDLGGLAAFAAAQADGPAAVAAGFTAIFAHLIGLLAAFIGAPLTARLIRESWPDLGEAMPDLEERP